MSLLLQTEIVKDQKKQEILDKYNVTVTYGDRDINEIIKEVMDKNLKKYVDDYIKRLKKL